MSRTIRLFLVACAASLCSGAVMPANPAAKPVPASSRYDVTAISEEFERQCRDGSFSGVVVVRVGGQNIFDRQCGTADIINNIPITRETRFKIYSTSKLMTALTVMRLVEQRKMALDDPIAKYISDLPMEWQQVTVRQLLNHSSGIPDLTGKMVEQFRTDQPQAVRSALTQLDAEERRLKNAPGTAFHYNNFGFELLADAASHASGMDFATLVAQEIFQPARMMSATIEAPNMVMGHPLPVAEPGLAFGYNGEPGKLEQATNYAFVQLGAGAIRASAEDFIALDAALSSGKLLSRSSMREMTRALLPDERLESGRRFGLGIIVSDKDGVRMEGHTGGTNGFISDFERYPDENAMMIALTNRGFAKTRWLRDGIATMLKSGR
jgi:D-alanyl-D-alanine carboxypeptidase